MGVYYVVLLLVKTRKAGSSGTGLFPPQSFHFSCSSFSFRCFFLSFFLARCYDARNLGSNNHRHLAFFAETFSNSSFIPASACSMHHASCPLSKKVIQVLILGAKSVPCVVAHEYICKCLSDDRMVRNQDITSGHDIKIFIQCMFQTDMDVCHEEVCSTSYSVPGVESGRVWQPPPQICTMYALSCTIMYVSKSLSSPHSLFNSRADIPSTQHCCCLDFRSRPISAWRGGLRVCGTRRSDKTLLCTEHMYVLRTIVSTEKSKYQATHFRVDRTVA